MGQFQSVSLSFVLLLAQQGRAFPSVKHLYFPAISFRNKFLMTNVRSVKILTYTFAPPFP